MKLNRSNSKYLLDTQDAVYRKKLIESVESDELNKEALDGFVHSDITWSDVQHMDKRYVASKKQWTRSKWLFRGLSILALVLVAGSYFVTKQSNQNDSKQNKIVAASKTIKNDRSIPPNLMDEANSNELNSGIDPIPTNTFVRSIVQSSILSSVSESIVNNPILVDSLTSPMKTLQPNSLSSSKELKIDGKVGQEVFIRSFKTVDYRVYRKKNTLILDESALLNGVSANNSGKITTIENQDVKEVSYFLFLSETMNYFNKGMIDLASENFDLILETFPEDVNALFYGGLCALEKKDFQKSITCFESVRINNFTNFREEAEWKLLNVYLLEKELSKAKSLRDEIIQKNGFYAKQAKSIEL